MTSQAAIRRAERRCRGRAPRTGRYRAAAWPPPSRRPSPSCPSRACASRPRSPPEEVERRVEQAARAARPRHAHPRLPQGQGPAAGRHPARRARGRPRRGGPRLARPLVRRRASTPPGIAPGRRPRRSTSATCRGEGEPLTFIVRDRRAPDGELGDVQGPRGRPARARGRRRGRRRRARGSCASASRASRPSTSAAAERRLRRHGLRRARRRRAVRGRRRAATS